MNADFYAVTEEDGYEPLAFLKNKDDFESWVKSYHVQYETDVGVSVADPVIKRTKDLTYAQFRGEDGDLWLVVYLEPRQFFNVVNTSQE